MLKTKNGSAHKDGVKVRGFFRVQITEDGKGVMGDSGWKENAVTYEGIEEYLIKWLTSGTGGLYVQRMALGTGTQPGTGDTTLNGELFHKSTNDTVNSRASVSSSIIASQTAQFTAAFASANSFVTAAANISNIGLFNSYLTSLANVGTLFAGNTFASSSCATNQSVCQEHWRTLLVIAKRKLFKLREPLIKIIETIRSEILNWRRSETIIKAPAFCGMMG